MTIRQVTIDGATWTPIVAPVACNTVTLADAAGATAIKLRSDPFDSTTEVSIAAAAQPYAFGARPIGSGRSMYQSADRVVYAQSAAGTITVVATYV